jgi:hypothetical protein
MGSFIFVKTNAAIGQDGLPLKKHRAAGLEVLKAQDSKDLSFQGTSLLGRCSTPGFSHRKQ